MPAGNGDSTQQQGPSERTPILIYQQQQQQQQQRHTLQPNKQPHNMPAEFSRRWWLQRIRYYVPIVGWLPNYKPATSLATDVKAGFMVACLLVPQALSYSSLTHLPPAFGLYTALVPAFVYGMLGTSRHLSMGPEALVSVLMGMHIQSQLKHLYAAYSPNTPPLDTIDDFSVAVASVVALVSGLSTFALGMFRFGFLDSMISEASLRGFISGAAVVVLIGQTRLILGIPVSGSDHSSPWDDLWHMLSHISQLHVATAAISVGALLLLKLLAMAKRLGRSVRWLQNVPDTLVVLILSTVISGYMELNNKYGVHVFGAVDGELPRISLPRVPHLAVNKDIVTSGITITMIGVVESVIVAREYASRNHYAVSSNRELVALGVSNIVGSAFGAYPSFGSLSRSKLNDRAQATSQLSGMVAALLVLVSLLGLLPYLYHLPLGVLAAIIVDAVFSLLSATPHAIVFLFRVRAWSDLFLLLFICVCSVVASVETGILLAVVISLIIVIKRSNMPRIKLLGRSADNPFDFRPIDEVAPAGVRRDEMYEEDTMVRRIEGVLIVRIEEPLYFANTGQLHTRLNRLELYGDMRAHPSEDPRVGPIRAVVFDLAGMADIDGSALEILLSIVREYQRRQVQVAFARANALVKIQFERSGIDAAYEFTDIHSALVHLEHQFNAPVVTSVY